MGSYALKTISTINAVRQALEDEIFSLVYPPGTKLTEIELADHYGVSRNTIREATAPLIANGVLIKEANKGLFVRQIAIKDIRQIFRLREILEREAAEAICTKEQLSSGLTEALRKIEEYDENRDWLGSLRADIDFHEALVKEADNARLLRLYQSILYEVKMCVFQSHGLSPLRRENSTEHQKIIDALEHKNVKLAQALLSYHIEHAINNYEVDYIAHHGVR